MKDDLLKSFTEGFKDSFRLAGYLFLAVVSVISAFSNHSLNANTIGRKAPPSSQS